MYNFAADHPKLVRCIAGIFNVGDLRSYPGLGRAAPAYGLDEAGMARELSKNNPIERLRPIAKAGIPILLLHGDQDQTVPIEENSAVIFRRYKELGGPIKLIVIHGQGHDESPKFFQSQALADFLLGQGHL